MKKLLERNHEIKVCIKTKDILEQLLEYDNVRFENILPEGRKDSKISILIGQLKKDYRLARSIRKDNIDLVIGNEPAIAHIGKLYKIPSLITVEDDTHVIPYFAFLTYPFTSHILAPSSCDIGRWSKKKISYEGYQKLTYLHPKYFKPDKSKIRSFVGDNEKYFLLRFSKLSAHHDFNRKGISNDMTRKIISILSDHGRVFISAEGPLEEEFQKYKSPFHPNDIHHVLFYSDIFIGDSQSMTMEAAMLGIPSLRFNDFVGQIGVLEELEKTYQLTYGIKTSEPELLFFKLKELLAFPNLKQEWQGRHKNMLLEKIDVTGFIVWFIENYPGSVETLKNNPEFQFNFK